jgi:hypothetical protein
MPEHTLNEVLWQGEKKFHKQIRKWLFRILLVSGCLLMLAFVEVTQPLFRHLPLAKDIPPVSSSKLREHVRILVEDFFPRDSEHPQNLDRAASYVSEYFNKAHGAVVEQPFEVKRKLYRNVIASFGPETRDKIIVGAHYDTAGEMPGSDDNASGIAGLLELAVLLYSAHLDTGVDLVAFTLEEPPYFSTEHMGSAVHANSLKKQNSIVRIMISLEMIAFFTNAPNSQRFPLPMMDLVYPTRGNFISVISNIGQGGIVRRVKRAMQTASTLPVYSFNAPAFMPGINLSDHMNYWKCGYDAVMITDTAFMRNSRYHTAEDNPDTLDYERMAMTVQGVYAAILEFARNK